MYKKAIRNNMIFAVKGKAQCGGIGLWRDGLGAVLCAP